MEFITVTEYNIKEDKTHLYFCQWNGNEEELQKLMSAIVLAVYANVEGEYSLFAYIDVPTSEKEVDEYVNSPNQYDHFKYYKYSGIFQCPDFGLTTDRDEMAKMITKILYPSRLVEHFKEPVADT